MTRHAAAPVLLALALTPATLATAGDAPLHARIDALVAAGLPDFEKRAAPVAGDAEFLRRVTLDLTGTVPSAADARAFLADPAADKRERLIDRLLASPEHARHLAHTFDVLWSDRRPDKRVPAAAWRDFLFTSFAANKPYDEIVREVLSADGVDPTKRGPAKFYLERDAEPTLVTRDIGRLFLGRNLQCAQCHDHPHVDEWKQEHFWGVMAFLNRTSLFPNANDAKAVLAEKADGEVSYQNVFDKAKVVKTTGPRLPGEPAFEEPKPEKGKEYTTAPAANVRGVPAYSRRARLAAQVTTHPAFARTAANRLWALMLGRGLVHPLDFDHEGNAPSHPALLDLLAKEFADSKHDVRRMLRELALSATYQRGSELPASAGEVEPDRFAAAVLKPLTPEQMAFATMQATGLTDGVRAGLGDKATEAAVYAQLAPNVTHFANAFGGVPGQPQGEFSATLDQSLFVANGKVVRGWLPPRPGNLADRLSKLAEARATADELYLSVLTRPATPDETREVADFLAGRPDRAKALSELTLALLSSTEFRFNH